MPPKVRWTASADQTLLLKILETNDLTVDTTKVAAAWPGDADARPTPRAIKERLAKIKEMAKNAGPDGLPAPTTPTTPTGKKPGGAAKGKTTPRANKSPARKRKRVKTPSPDPTESDLESDFDGKATSDNIADFEELDKVAIKRETDMEGDNDQQHDVDAAGASNDEV